MSVKAGQMVPVGNGVVVSRVQSFGVTSLNQPTARVNELGNRHTVATIRDTPDLTFDMESNVVDCAAEALSTGVVPSAVVADQGFNLDSSMPFDATSPWKSALDQFNTVAGLAVPFLTLDTATYRFGLHQDATQTFTFRGDAMYFIPGSPEREAQTLASGANHTYSFAKTPAVVYVEKGQNIWAYSVHVRNNTTKAFKRLFLGTDYTNTSTGFTVLADWSTQGYNQIVYVYGTTQQDTYNDSVFASTSVAPAALRGKDIDVYVSDGAATPTYVRWGGVQSVDVTRRVTLDKDEEFGNNHVLAQDYDVPDVSGNVTLKPIDPAALFTKLDQIGALSSSQTVGPYSAVPLGLEIRLSHPDTGVRLKTISVPDARFNLPAYQGRVQQKASVQISWAGDSGAMTVYNGVSPVG